MKVEVESEKTRPSKMVSKPIDATTEAFKMVESTLFIVVMQPKAKMDEAPTESTSHEASSKDAIESTLFL